MAARGGLQAEFQIKQELKYLRQEARLLSRIKLEEAKTRIRSLEQRLSDLQKQNKPADLPVVASPPPPEQPKTA